MHCGQILQHFQTPPTLMWETQYRRLLLDLVCYFLPSLAHPTFIFIPSVTLGCCMFSEGYI